ncbi:MAG: response regulator transcription factor [Prolixibacteraceae bacterium]|jgi:two-component system response regulator NreC|nr:response regulator transcription factor [Prolixibacteraceae bacterium]
MIDIALFDEHKLVLEGLAGLLSDVSEFRVVLVCSDRNLLTEKLKSMQVHVLILNMHDISVRNLNLIVQLGFSNTKLKILVTSVIDSEEIVLKTIKAGAKGFLGKDSDRNNLVEAIYTLRSGHDYYSASITHLLLNRYISSLKSDGLNQRAETESLSSRQIEILKLWGESYTNQEIADHFFISVRTVESHKNHIMQKLNLKSTVDMIKFAIKNNIIEI